MQTEKHQCTKRVSRPPAFLEGTLCRRRATHCEDGSWWCSFHAPSKVLAEEKKQRQKSDLKFAKIEEDARRLASFPRLLAAAEDVLVGLGKYGTVYKPLEEELREAINAAKGPNR